MIPLAAVLLFLGARAQAQTARGGPVEEGPGRPALSEPARAMLVLDLARNVLGGLPPLLEDLGRSQTWDVCDYGYWKHPRRAEARLQSFLRDDGVLLRCAARLYDGLPTTREDDDLVNLARLREDLSESLARLQQGDDRQPKLCRTYAALAPLYWTAEGLSGKGARALTGAEIEALDALDRGEGVPGSAEMTRLDGTFADHNPFDAAKAQEEVDRYLKAPVRDAAPQKARKTRLEREREINQAVAQRELDEQNRQAAKKFAEELRKQKRDLERKGVVWYGGPEARRGYYECGRRRPPLKNNDPRLAGFIQDKTCAFYTQPITLDPRGLP